MRVTDVVCFGEVTRGKTLRVRLARGEEGGWPRPPHFAGWAQTIFRWNIP